MDLNELLAMIRQFGYALVALSSFGVMPFMLRVWRRQQGDLRDVMLALGVEHASLTLFAMISVLLVGAHTFAWPIDPAVLRIAGTMPVLGWAGSSLYLLYLIVFKENVN